MKTNNPKKEQRLSGKKSRGQESALRDPSFHFTRRHSRIANRAEAIIKALLAGCAACGMNLLVCDSAWLDVPFYAILLTAAFWITVFFLLFKSKKSAILGAATVVIALAAISVHLGRTGIAVNPFTYLAGGAACLWNRMMVVIDALGYVTLPQIGMNWHQSDYSAIFFLSLVSCLIYYLSVRKKTKLSVSSIFTALLCAPIFIYNMPNDNVGICVLLAATTSFAAMKVCEKHTADISSSAHIGLAAMLLSALLLIIPCYTINRPWIRIDAISEKIEQLRQIITDIAEGKPISIPDILSGDPTGDRSTAVENRNFRGTEMFYVYSDSNAPLYLRNWIGEEFSDNTWSAPDPGRFGYTDHDTPYIVTEDFLNLYAEYWKRVWEFTDSVSAPAFYGDPAELGLAYSDILITPKSQTRLLAIPYMTVSPVTNPIGTPFSVGYERIKDGIYLANERLSTVTPYRVQALIPLSRTEEYRKRLFAFAEFSRQLSEGTTSPDPYWEIDGIALRNNTYTELADLLYSKNPPYSEIPYSYAVNKIVEDLFLTTEIARYYHTAPVSDSSYPGNTAVTTVTDGMNGTLAYYADKETILLAADAIAHIVIDYLSEHYRYNLTPPSPSSDDSMEEFLLISKEGYCVQFATAATLIMRHLGFSARYAEGYIANNFKKNSISNGYAYECRVIDRNAHAWMEVWIDGFGWMQYEVTPGFTDGAYSVNYSFGTGDDPVPPDTTEEITTEAGTTEGITALNPPDTSRPPVETHNPPVTSEPITTVPGSSDETTPSGSTGILLVAFAVIAIVSVTVVLIGKRSSDKQKYRKKLLALALSADGKENTSVGASLCTALFDTLRAFGLVPGSSELPSAFAERADSALSGVSLDRKPSEAIYAAEKQIYGNGMTKENLHAAATVIIGLTSHAKTRLGTVRFLWYRYILCII